MDTRVGLGGPALTGGATREVAIGGTSGVPADATGAMLNVTVVNGTQPSWLAVWPSGAAFPGTSNLNWTDVQAHPNLASVQLGTNGAVSMRIYAGTADVVVDLAGYYVGGGAGAPGPVGPAGPQGPAGVPGPAGAFRLQDANGQLVPGRLLGLNSQAGNTAVLVVQDDNYTVNYDLVTGQVGYAAPDRVYASGDCTGPELYDLAANGAPAIPNLLFTDTFNEVPGSPLFSIGTIDPTFAAGSRIKVDQTVCDPTPSTIVAVTRVPYGTIQPPPPGPLKIVG